MGERTLKVILLQAGDEHIVAKAGRLCYSKDANIEDLLERLTDEDCNNFVQKLASIGHLSTFEHSTYTFGIEGISRVTSHQLVRHRFASNSQQSQRYVDASKREFDYIIPKTIAKNPKTKKIFLEEMEHDFQLYQILRNENIPPEDARYLLPNATETKILCSMNARELLHFFSLRICERAQWEIRHMADEMLRLVKIVAPHIFAKAGPTCYSEKICYEGNMSCGLYKKYNGILHQDLMAGKYKLMSIAEGKN